MVKNGLRGLCLDPSFCRGGKCAIPLPSGRVPFDPNRFLPAEVVVPAPKTFATLGNRQRTLANTLFLCDIFVCDVPDDSPPFRQTLESPHHLCVNQHHPPTNGDEPCLIRGSVFFAVSCFCVIQLPPGRAFRSLPPPADGV